MSSASLVFIIIWFGVSMPFGVFVGKLLAGAAGVLDEALASPASSGDVDAVVSDILV